MILTVSAMIFLEKMELLERTVRTEGDGLAVERRRMGFDGARHGSDTEW